MSNTSEQAAARFDIAPHKTLLGLALPVMLGVIMEPLTALVDTAFVSRLGSTSLAALGAAAVLTSGFLWLFGFLRIGTQSDVAHHLGRRDADAARHAVGLALAWSFILGVLSLALIPTLPTLMAWMTPDADVQVAGRSYMLIRVFGFAPVLMTKASFGALRGHQDVRTPLMISLGVNALNIPLNACLIFGLGPFPALGIEGAAWATVLAQWVGMVWSLTAIARTLGLPRHLDWRHSWSLFAVGRDLVIRGGCMLLFTLFAKRTALGVGTIEGAAHQVAEQVWFVFGYAFDAYGVAAQSLAGFSLGEKNVQRARRASFVALFWGVVTGVIGAACLWLLTPWIERGVVPADAVSAFRSIWWICMVTQPLNAVCFVLDGIHWGTKDYPYLRNGVVGAAVISIMLFTLIDIHSPHALIQTWAVMCTWILMRSIWGFVRLWPAWGGAPLRLR